MIEVRTASVNAELLLKQTEQLLADRHAAKALEVVLRNRIAELEAEVSALKNSADH